MPKREFEKELQEAAKILREGGIVLYPTDTIWGLGCDATNEEAVKKIYEIKNRDTKLSMIVLVDSVDRVPFYVSNMPDVAWDLIELTTDPLTIIYSNAKNLAKSAIATNNSVAIRVTNEYVSNALCYLLKRPIISTSANISGEVYPKNFGEISQKIKEKVNYIVPFRQDEKSEHIPSKIIKLSENGEFKIIR